MSEADRLILEAATGARQLKPSELRRVREHVAQAGFDPAPRSRATGLSGLEWQGRTLRGGDRITAAEQHYLKHVIRQREWPASTSLADYLASIRRAILNPANGVFTSRYRGQWQLGIVGPSRDMRGLRGGALILVEYRVDVGYWVTAYQPEHGIKVLRDPERTDVRWLRRPPRN